MTLLGLTDDGDKGDNDDTDNDDKDDDDDDDDEDDDDDDLQWTEMGPSWPNCSLVLCTLKGYLMKPVVSDINEDWIQR